MGRRTSLGIFFIALFTLSFISVFPGYFDHVSAQDITFTEVADPTFDPNAPIVAEGQQLTPIPASCIAFNPYVGNLNPNTGPHPSPALINTLLDQIIKTTPYRCILTYGVLNGLDYTFAAAKARGIKVIAIIWLDKNATVNSQSIQKGIAVAKAYPNTIVRISCGSELRTRSVPFFNNIIKNCINKLRKADVKQPITTIDTWWEWCNESYPCSRWSMADYVDWIGINVFPWWENKYSGIFPCTTAANAANFNIARLRNVKNYYPGKDVVLTEFGWPAGPSGYRETNLNTGQRCGVANEANQTLVISNTLSKLKSLGWSGIVFESFRENWKASEGKVGPYWGICKGVAPYICKTLNLSLDSEFSDF